MSKKEFFIGTVWLINNRVNYKSLGVLYKNGTM